MNIYKNVISRIAPLIKLYHRMDVFDIGNVPPEGKGFILTPNHTNWFGWDALVISSILKGRKIRWVSWSYDETNPLWDMQAKAFDAILYNKKKPFPYEEISAEISEQGTIVGIFPEGNNNPVGKWYRLRPFFPGCVRLSVMTGAPIVPVSVAGLEEASPILWIEEKEGESPTWLVALPGLLPTKVKVRFGEPFYPTIKKKQLKDKQVLFNEAEKVQLEVLKLLKNDRPNARAETFRGGK